MAKVQSLEPTLINMLSLGCVDWRMSCAWNKYISFLNQLNYILPYLKLLTIKSTNKKIEKMYINAIKRTLYVV